MYKKKDCIELLHIKKVNTRARAAPLFKTIIPKCKKYKNSVLYNGAVRWNSLPVNIRDISYYESSLYLYPISKKEICCISKNLLYNLLYFGVNISNNFIAYVTKILNHTIRVFPRTKLYPVVLFS